MTIYSQCDAMPRRPECFAHITFASSVKQIFDYYSLHHLLAVFVIEELAVISSIIISARVCVCVFVNAHRQFIASVL